MDRTTSKRITRKLRDRKERKCYMDDWALGEADEEIEGPQSFDLEEKLTSDQFDWKHVKELSGYDFNLAYIQQFGFTEPILFKNKDGLGLRIPGPDFGVGDVKTLVGSKRLLDVMDVRTQKNVEMNMKQWQEYYEKKEKDRLLNVISLEFSHTRLENYVESPTVVRQLDWVDRVWPKHLKNLQTESTNVMDEMMYPKVQKYCLMSVKGCFTDFHVDFGGTSVWYHILKGAKVFWLIPPTDKNLDLYQTWVLSGKQGDTFFADNVAECSRVYLSAGDTFFIPSGWIHAVYTPKDSLVFGGNFLHSFGIEKQLKIATVEEHTKVPQKFRYPFFTEMLWYTLERYVHCLLGKSFIKLPSDDDASKSELNDRPLNPPDIAITAQELVGLKGIVLYLHQLPIQRKNVPTLIYDPVSVLRCVRQIVEAHRYDSHLKAVTGKPVLVWPGERAEDVGKISSPEKIRDFNKQTNFFGLRNEQFLDGGVESPIKRVRCGVCQSCNNKEDCNQCLICYENSIHYRNTPRRKFCIMRQCLKPNLPITATCSLCGLDGWNDIPGPSVLVEKNRDAPSSLMECSICFQITHALCLPSRLYAKTVGLVSEDLPNSWECPACLQKVMPASHNKRMRMLERRASIENNCSSMPKSPSEMKLPSSISTEAQKQVKDMSYITSENESSTSSKIPKDEKPESPPINKKQVVDDKRGNFIRRRSTDETINNVKIIAGKMSSAVKRTLSTSSEGPAKKKKKESDKSRKKLSKDKEIKINTQPSTPEEVTASSGTKVLVKKEPESSSEEKDETTDDDSSKHAMVSSRHSFRNDLASRIMSASSISLKNSNNVVRPSESCSNEKRSKSERSSSCQNFLANEDIWIPVFKKLKLKDLFGCLLTCKAWNKMGMSPKVWSRIDLRHKVLYREILYGCVRRQPDALIMDWANISKQQLIWVLSRMPQLKQLSLQGIPWSTVRALKTCYCPALIHLNLGYVEQLADLSVREILAPPTDSRPGLTEGSSRLKLLESLSLAGAHLSDISLRYVTQHAGNISKLDLSCCPRITDAGIAQIGAPDSPSLTKLTHLYLTGCPQLTNISLDHLSRCKSLKFLDICSIPQITRSGLSKFMSQINSKSHKITVMSSYPTITAEPSKNALESKPSCSNNSASQSSVPPKAPGSSNSVVVTLMP